MCKKRKGGINQVEAEIEEQEIQALFLGPVEVENVQPEDINIDKQSVGKWEIEMPAKNGKIRFKIDTGAEVTVIGEQHFSCL